MEKNFFVSGELKKEAWQDAILYLGRLGLLTEEVDRSVLHDYRKHLEEILPTRYLTDISSRDQFIGREHIIAYRRQYLDKVPERIAVRAFTTFIRPQRFHKNNQWTSLPVRSKESGLIILDREEAGLLALDRVHPAYRPTLVKDERNKAMHFALQVGSLVDFMDNFSPDNDDFRGFGERQEFFMRHLAAFLKRQTQEAKTS